jgi:hypothetical protein
MYKNVEQCDWSPCAANNSFTLSPNFQHFMMSNNNSFSEYGDREVVNSPLQYKQCLERNTNGPKIVLYQCTKGVCQTF